MPEEGPQAQSTTGMSNQPLAWPWEPSLAALLFATHPVHTEAVAGIVGHAELLSCALSLLAFLTYIGAAEDSGLGFASHWARLGCTVLFVWAAALAKEIGITIVSVDTEKDEVRMGFMG